MARYKGAQWNLSGNDWDRTVPVDTIKLALLMDLRAELKELRAVMTSVRDILLCPNFQMIPRKLDRISRNTAKPRKKVS